MPAAALTIRRLTARAVNVPMRLPLATSGGTVATAPLVLVDLVTAEGVTGCGYIFAYTPIAVRPLADLVRNLEPVLAGEAVAPLAIERKLQARFRLLGPQGLTGMAMAAIDMAAWDALAKAAGLPLARLLGGELRPIPAYNSCGLGIIGAHHAAAEAVELLAPGFRAIKVRLGYPDLETDLAVVRAVRRAAGGGIVLLSDYNQSLPPAEAIRRGRALDDEGLAWIEEPTRADDYAGHAAIADALETPVQLGENWWGSHDMAKSIAAGASDLLMPDACKIGGVSGWLRAAALADAAARPVSSHLFPEVSAHLLAVTSTAHWLEWVDWASPILQEPAVPKDGHLAAPDRPGIGIAWDEAAVERYAA
ncbi:MAG: enolase C-terminal domain-like protein [Pseudomonadota bacterium]